MLCPNCFAELNNPGRHCTTCGYPLESSQEPHLLPSGTILHNTYIIGRVLGEGGFGITYLAFNKNIQMKVAIKEFFPKGVTSRNSTYGNDVSSPGNTQPFEIAKQQFINEARMLAKFQYLPGIASVYDCFEENGTAYIVMEYIEGRTLKAVLRQYPGKMEVERCLSLMKPVMEALDELHRSGIIHRDISPDNLIMRQKGMLVLIDFGAARDFVINQGYDLSVILRRKYAPIEQYSSKNIQGPWTDVYALSATIYRCITGITPPESTDRIMKDEIKSPSELGIKINPSVENALMKGLAILGENRYQSITALKEGLYNLKEVEPQKEERIMVQTSEELIIEEDEKTEGITFGQMEFKQPSVDITQSLFETNIKEDDKTEGIPFTKNNIKEDDKTKGIPFDREEIKQYSEETTQSALDISKVDQQKSKKKYFAVAGLLLAILVGVIVFMSNPERKLESLIEKAQQGDVEAMVDAGDMYFNGDKIEQDYASALEWYKKAAEKGNAAVMTKIGDMYGDGTGVKKDYKKAKDWYKKGVALGDSLSIFKNGEMYEYGRGVKLNKDLAEEWYQLSEDIDSKEGMYNLGDMYYLGKGIPKDPDKAMEWYQKAADAGSEGAENRIKAEKGDAKAMSAVGDMYRDGVDVNQNSELAIKWYEKAAKKKNAQAMCKIGNMYYNGKVVKQDYKKAKQWFEKGVALGDSTSATRIGDMYEYGKGVKKNQEYADDWHYIGGNNARSGGMNCLGYMYEFGRGVKQDYKKAIEWYKKAAEKGNATSMGNLGYMYDEGRGVKQDYKKALEWYKKAAEKGNNYGMTGIADIYYYAKGVKQDYKKALEWYKKAAEKGNDYGMYSCGYMYEYGQGTKADHKKAVEWLKKAAKKGHESAKEMLKNLGE